MSDIELVRRRRAERRGRRSESLAVLALRLKGFRILGRRVRNPAGEIDLVARSPFGILCFVEVKARSAEREAVESVGLRQRQRIARAAEHFLAAHPALKPSGVRFDVVAVSPRSWPKHFPDAWRPDGG